MAVGLLAGAAYAGYANSRPEHPVDEMAQQAACRTASVCESSPRAVDVDPFSRSYQFDLSTGTLFVECRWAFVLVGDVECKTRHEGMPAPRANEGERPPHQLGRGGERR